MRVYLLRTIYCDRRYGFHFSNRILDDTISLASAFPRYNWLTVAFDVFIVPITVKFGYCRYQGWFCDLHLSVCFNRSDCFRRECQTFSNFVVCVLGHALEVSLCGQCKTGTCSTFPESKPLQDVYLDSWVFPLQQTVVFPLHSYMFVHTAFRLVFRR